MKRIIAFLLILSILMTSFACTAKPEPEPDPFTPLQNEFVSAVYPAKSIDGLAIRWIHEDLIEVLDGSSWVQKDSLLDQGGVFTVQLNDQNGDTYRFFAPGNGLSEYFVSVTEASTNQRRAYVLQQSVVEGLLSTIEEYAQSVQVLQYPLVSLASAEYPTTPLTNTYLLEPLKRTLGAELWVRVNVTTPLESLKRYVMVDEQGDTYSFYVIAANAQYAYVKVDRADQTSMLFRVRSIVLDELATLMDRSVDDIVNQYYQNLLKSYFPTQVYLGDTDSYEDSKLSDLPDQVSYLFNTRLNTLSYYLSEFTGTFDPQAEVLFIARSEDGTYLTVYALPPTVSLDGTEDFCLVSMGKHPLAHSENQLFRMWIAEVQRLTFALTLSPTEESRPLELSVDVNDSVEFPAFNMDFEVRYQSYSGKLNQAIVDYLKKLEALDWTPLSFEEVGENSILGYQSSVIITAANGTRYHLPYNSNVLIVDEDPLTPGALVYTTTYESLWALGDIEATLEYLAQLESDYAFSTLKITSYTLYSVDDETGDETFEDVAFTEAQSAALSALILDAKLFKKTYDNMSWGWNLSMLFSTSSNLTIGLRAPRYGESDPVYAVITINDPDHQISGDYFISFEDYNAILELYLSYLK